LAGWVHRDETWSGTPGQYRPDQRQDAGGAINAESRNVIGNEIRDVGELAGRIDRYRDRLDARQDVRPKRQ
jgi:hypothetical protein